MPIQPVEGETAKMAAERDGANLRAREALLYAASLTLVGLVLALLEDGVWDWLSWMLLGILIMVLVLKTLKSRLPDG